MKAHDGHGPEEVDDPVSEGLELSPRATEAVRSGLEQLNFVVDELEAEKQQNRELHTKIAGYKVAMEAQDARVADLESRAKTAILERDQAVADRVVWETLFVSIKAQLRAFAIPNAPLVKDKSEEADRALDTQTAEARNRMEAQGNMRNPYDLLQRRDDHQQRRTIVPDTQGSA